jgi:hypothetical protein
VITGNVIFAEPFAPPWVRGGAIKGRGRGNFPGDGDAAMSGMIDAKKRGGSESLPAFRSWKTRRFSFGRFTVG